MLTKSFSALNVFVDLLCATIPIIVIRDLQLQVRSKFALASILISCGAVTAACAIGKVATLPTGPTPGDPTFEWVNVAYFQAAEQYGGLMFASLPAINQLQSHFRTARSIWPQKGSDHLNNARAAHDGKRITRSSNNLGEAGFGIRRTTSVYIELSNVNEHKAGKGSQTSDVQDEQPPSVRERREMIARLESPCFPSPRLSKQ